MNATHALPFRASAQAERTTDLAPVEPPPVFTGPRTLAPRPEDAPDATQIEVDISITVTVPVVLSEHLQADPSGDGFYGDSAGVELSGTLVREMSSEGDDPEDGVSVKLAGIFWAYESFAGATGKPPKRTHTPLSFGPLTVRSVSEFRRLIAGLNALAAALPAYPEAAR